MPRTVTRGRDWQAILKLMGPRPARPGPRDKLGLGLRIKLESDLPGIITEWAAGPGDSDELTVWLSQVNSVRGSHGDSLAVIELSDRVGTCGLGIMTVIIRGSR